MAGEYKSACGCKIHVAQWTSKRKIVTQESCSVHKTAPEMLHALQEVKACSDMQRGGWLIPNRVMTLVEEILSKATPQNDRERGDVASRQR